MSQTNVCKDSIYLLKYYKYSIQIILIIIFLLPSILTYGQYASFFSDDTASFFEKSFVLKNDSNLLLMSNPNSLLIERKIVVKEGLVFWNDKPYDSMPRVKNARHLRAKDKQVDERYDSIVYEHRKYCFKVVRSHNEIYYVSTHSKKNKLHRYSLNKDTLCQLPIEALNIYPLSIYDKYSCFETTFLKDTIITINRVKIKCLLFSSYCCGDLYPKRDYYWRLSFVDELSLIPVIEIEKIYDRDYKLEGGKLIFHDTFKKLHIMYPSIMNLDELSGYLN